MMTSQNSLDFRFNGSDSTDNGLEVGGEQDATPPHATLASPLGLPVYMQHLAGIRQPFLHAFGLNHQALRFPFRLSVRPHSRVSL